jgi:AcrR family transcriptional regulator
MPRPRKSRRRDSRGDILRAAGAEFAAHGFDAAGVDRIAARAGINKAMLYYHFGSKRELYLAVLRETLEAVVRNARLAADAPADSGIRRLDAYVASLLQTATADPHMVPLLMRELADGAQHLDARTLRLMTSVFGVIEGILADGRRQGEFRDVDPLLTHLMIMGATMFYVGNRPIRRRVSRMKQAFAAPVRVPQGADAFLRHMQLVLRGVLCRGHEVAPHA